QEARRDGAAIRRKGRDRVGKPDSLVRFSAVSNGERSPNRRGNQQCAERDGRRYRHVHPGKIARRRSRKEPGCPRGRLTARSASRAHSERSPSVTVSKEDKTTPIEDAMQRNLRPATTSSKNTSLRFSRIKRRRRDLQGDVVLSKIAHKPSL